MKKLYLSYLPPIFFRVAEKRSFVPRLAAFFHAHARCSECFSESPYIPPFIAPFLIHVSTILSMILGLPRKQDGRPVGYITLLTLISRPNRGVKNF